jgi:hypothetical protein
MPHTLFRQDFAHDEGVRMYARHLEVMRDDMGDDWWRLAEERAAAGKRARRGSRPAGAWTPERIGFAGLLIRRASESADHAATVDFVTQGALAHIRQSAADHPRRTIGNLTQWDLFTHEHMVPGAAALALLTDPTFADNRGPLQGLLTALSWRALVTGTKRRREKDSDNFEVGQLDAAWASGVPAPADVPGWRGPAELIAVPLQYHGLLRYDAAGLLDQLVSVSLRSTGILEQYQAYKAGGAVQENLAA